MLSLSDLLKSLIHTETSQTQTQTQTTGTVPTLNDIGNMLAQRLAQPQFTKRSAWPTQLPSQSRPLPKGALTEVLCKLCHGAIMIMKQGKLRPNASYTTVDVVAPDGSVHTTPLCTSCAAKATPMQLELCRLADLAEMELEGA